MSEYPYEHIFKLVPEKWNFIAMNKNGNWLAYNKKPTLRDEFWELIGPSSEAIMLDQLNIKMMPHNSGWNFSLRERSQNK